MSEAIKPTPGPWTFYTEPQPNGCPIVGNSKGLMVAMVAHSVNYPGQKETALGDASLIAEAGTAHHETGLTPRQLVERVKELEGALRDLSNAFMAHTRWNGDPPAEVAQARAALSKSLPNTVAETP